MSFGSRLLLLLATADDHATQRLLARLRVLPPLESLPHGEHRMDGRADVAPPHRHPAGGRSRIHGRAAHLRASAPCASDCVRPCRSSPDRGRLLPTWPIVARHSTLHLARLARGQDQRWPDCRHGLRDEWMRRPNAPSWRALTGHEFDTVHGRARAASADRVMALPTFPGST